MGNGVTSESEKPKATVQSSECICRRAPIPRIVVWDRGLENNAKLTGPRCPQIVTAWFRNNRITLSSENPMTALGPHRS